MESFLNRYRSITILLLAILAQLVLVAFQVKKRSDVRMIRVWTVTAVSPVARIVEALRGGQLGLHPQLRPAPRYPPGKPPASGRSRRLKLENNDLKNEIGMADRAKALAVFQSRTPLQDGGGHCHHGRRRHQFQSRVCRSRARFRAWNAEWRW